MLKKHRTYLLIISFLLIPQLVLLGCNDNAHKKRDASQKAAALNDSALVVFERIVMNQTSQTYDDVLYLLDQAIAADSTYRAAYGSKVSVLQHVGRNEEAAEVMRRWLKNHPGDTSARTMLAMILGIGGEIRAANQQLEIVLRERNRQIELHPDSTDLYVERAFVKLLLGRQEEAVAELDSLLAANPESRSLKLMYDIAVSSDKEQIARTYLGQ